MGSSTSRTSLSGYTSNGPSVPTHTLNGRYGAARIASSLGLVALSISSSGSFLPTRSRKWPFQQSATDCKYLRVLDLTPCRGVKFGLHRAYTKPAKFVFYPYVHAK